MPEHVTSTTGLLADEIFDRALLRGTFTLRSGATSDRYFDKYRVTCDPTLLGPVAAAMAERIRSVAPSAEVIVAPALGAVPLAAALSLELGLPTLFVRDSSKSYGTNRRIEGTITPRASAVLIEDVVTSGGAALDALAEARAAELEVTASFCVLDRDSGGREALAAADAPLTALFGIDELNAAFDAGRGTEVAAS